MARRKPDNPKVTEEELLQMVKREAENAIGFWTDSLSDDRDSALKLYFGLPYGDEEDGRSRAISMDCAQVVDWALPDLIEPFVSSERIVIFKPNKSQDIQYARQATDYCNFIFHEDNDAFNIIYSSAKDGLIQKVGVVKVFWDDQTVEIQETLEGVTEPGLGMLEAEEDVTVDAVRPEELPAFLPPPAGQEGPLQPIALHSVDITRTVNEGKVAIEVIPPEEFLISTRAANINDADYCAHVPEKTKSELIEMGFDAEVVEGLETTEGEQRDTDTNQGRAIRFHDERSTADTTTIQTQQDKVILYEEYVKVDMNDDGDTELIQVFRVGNTILEWNEIDDHPFESFCPEMIPHKFFGQSLVDKSSQTQRTKTVLTRQLLDGVYLANNPQREIPEDAIGDDTIADLLTYRVGGLVRTRRPGMLREIPITDRSTTALGAIQYFDQEREVNTGITRNSVGTPIDISREQTRAEVEKLDRGESSRKRLMARVFAETFIKPMFKKMLGLVIKYQDYERIVEVRGEWVPMSPKHWDSAMQATTAVGLGFAEKQEKLQGAMNILGLQEKAIQLGMADKEQFWNSASVVVEASGLQFPELFFIPPDQAQDPETPPDPALVKVQQDGQLAQMKLQQEGQLDQAKLQQDGQIEMAKIQQKAQLEQLQMQLKMRIEVAKIQMENAKDEEKAQGEFMLAVAKAQSEFELAVEQLKTETALAIREQQKEIALAMRDQELKSVVEVQKASMANGSGITNVRFGGKVG